MEREDKITSLTIDARVVGRPAGSVGSEIKGKLDALKMPSGITVAMRGDLERQTESFCRPGFSE